MLVASVNNTLVRISVTDDCSYISLKVLFEVSSKENSPNNVNGVDSVELPTP